MSDPLVEIVRALEQRLAAHAAEHQEQLEQLKRDLAAQGAENQEQQEQQEQLKRDLAAQGAENQEQQEQLEQLKQQNAKILSVLSQSQERDARSRLGELLILSFVLQSLSILPELMYERFCCSFSVVLILISRFSEIEICVVLFVLSICMLFGSAAELACYYSRTKCEDLPLLDIVRFLSTFGAQICMSSDSEGKWTWIWGCIMIVTIVFSTATLFVAERRPLSHIIVMCTYCYAAIMYAHLLAHTDPKAIASALQSLMPNPIATFHLIRTRRRQDQAGYHTMAI